MRKSNDLQPRLLYPAKLSFKIEGEIKSFPEKKKVVCCHQSSIATNVKGLALRRRKKEVNSLKNKMATNTYLSIITLNGNGLNAPIKRHQVGEWIRKQDPLYIVFKRPTSE